MARRLAKPVECTSAAESQVYTEDKTWSNGDEEGELACNTVPEGFDAAAGEANPTLTDVQAAIATGCGCLKFDHMSLATAG